MKKSITQVLIAVLLGLTIVSCEDDVDYLVTKTVAKEVSVPNSARVNEKFDIDMIVFGLSGCSLFSGFDMNQIGDTTYFELFQKRDKSATCTTAIIEIQATISVSFSEPGTKELIFKHSINYSGMPTEITKSIEIKE